MLNKTKTNTEPPQPMEGHQTTDQQQQNQSLRTDTCLAGMEAS